MQIPNDKILEMLQQQGKSDQAKQELPDQVDPEQHYDLLQKFGLKPQEMMSKLGGDIPASRASATPVRSGPPSGKARGFFRSTTKEITWSEG